MKLLLPARRPPRIEMLPLIDIVFLLLVFFIYAMLSMAVHRGLPVNLPSSSAAQLEKDMILSVTAQHLPDQSVAVFVDKQEVQVAELTQYLQAKAREMEQQGKLPGVLLFADNSISYQQLFQILDQVKSAGLKQVSLQAEVADD